MISMFSFVSGRGPGQAFAEGAATREEMIGEPRLTMATRGPYLRREGYGSLSVKSRPLLERIFIVSK